MYYGLKLASIRAPKCAVFENYTSPDTFSKAKEIKETCEFRVSFT